MNFTNRKTTVFIVAGSIFSIIFVSKILSKLSIPNYELTKKQSANEYEIDYKMGKAESAAGLYDLDGRPVQYEEIDENSDSIGNNQGKKSTLKQVVLDKKQHAKNAKKANSLKKSDLSKNINNIDKKNSNKNLLNNTKKNPDLALKNKEESTDSKVDSKSNLDSFNNGPSNYSLPIESMNNAFVNTDLENSNLENNKSKKTLEQVKEEYLKKLDQKSIVAFVGAYIKNEFSKEVFYKSIQELMVKKDTAEFGLGLYALRLTPSNESFAVLVNAQSGVSNNYNTYIQQSLMFYNQPGYLNILGNALKSKQKKLVIKSSEIVKSGLNQIRSGQVNQLVENRQARDVAVTSQISEKNYQVFLNIVNNRINTAEDNEIYAALESLKSTLIEKGVNQQVAQN